MAAGGQNLRRLLHGLGKVAGNGGQRGQKEIAETVAVQAGASMKAVLKQAREQRFIFREGGDAVANVAGRQNIELLAQAPAGAAIVGDGHHRAKLAHRAAPRSRSLSCGHVAL
jgi:hypothetical protein